MKEIEDLKKNLPKRIPFNYETFDGGHAHAPKESMDRAFTWLEEQLRFGLPHNNDLMPMYAQIYKTKQEQSGSLSSNFEKYEAIEELNKFALKHKLGTYSETKDLVKGIKATIKTLSKDRTVKRELKSRKTYQRLRDQENKFRTRMSGNKLKQGLSMFAQKYRQFYNKYKDTKYGKAAAQRFEELKEELEAL